jgi:hypothetical protein
MRFPSWPKRLFTALCSACFSARASSVLFGSVLRCFQLTQRSPRRFGRRASKRQRGVANFAHTANQRIAGRERLADVRRTLAAAQGEVRALFQNARCELALPCVVRPEVRLARRGRKAVPSQRAARPVRCPLCAVRRPPSDCGEQCRSRSRSSSAPALTSKQSFRAGQDPCWALAQGRGAGPHPHPPPRACAMHLCLHCCHATNPP